MSLPEEGMSSTEAVGVCPTVRTELSTVVESVRLNGLSERGREVWYPLFPRIIKDGSQVMIDLPGLSQSVGSSWRSTTQSFKKSTVGYEISEEVNRPGIGKVGDLSTALLHAKLLSSEDVRAMAILINKISESVSRIDFCFDILSKIGDLTSWYIDPNPTEHRANLEAFKYLIQARNPKTCKLLQSIGALNHVYIHDIFLGMFFPILPAHMAFRILDSFMIEGKKVLFR
jgi:hypothetical protein